MTIQIEHGPAHGWMPLDDWKARASKGMAPEGVILRKAYIPDEIAAVAGEDRTLSFTISTGSVDRDKDTINVGGWDLRNFKKVPTVLWAHDYGSLPVAKATSIKKENDRLIARAQFAEHEFADTVFQLIKGGFLKATSVGFRPIKFAFNEDRRGVDFAEQELLEFSVVPVPANPEALIEAQAKGIDIGPLKAWAEGLLTKISGEPGLFLPRSAIVAALELSRKDEKRHADPEKPEDEPRELDFAWKTIFDQHKQDGFEVQTVIFPKAHWDLDDAKKWAKDHDFRTDKVDETDQSFRFRQREPGDFERLRTICINPGRDTAPDSDSCKVKAVGGPLKAVDDSPPSLEVDGFEPSECFDVNEDEVNRLIRGAIGSAVEEAVEPAVRSAMMALTGRVD